MRTLLAVLATLAATLAAAPAHAASDRLLAPPAACPGQLEEGKPPAAQKRAMRCLISFARKQAGLPDLNPNGKLRQSAERKSRDIIRCGQFSHSACGRPFTFWPARLGYTRGCWSAAENIAWARGPSATPRVVFKSWLDSAGHRHNLLGKFRDQGLAVQRGKLKGSPGTLVWTHLFGERCR